FDALQCNRHRSRTHGLPGARPGARVRSGGAARPAHRSAGRISRRGVGDPGRTGTEEQTMKRTALITGASSGIGADLARLFARDGYDLVLTARDEAKMQALAKELGGNATIIPADLAKPDAPQQLAD